MNNYNLHKHLPLIVISVIDIALPCIVLYQLIHMLDGIVCPRSLYPYIFVF